MKPIVLVVDDEEANRLTLQRILVREGIDVRHAANGRDALQRVSEDKPALILTDLKMPTMGGIPLLRAVREVDPDLEVVVMTAYGSVETAVEAMKEGAYDFLSKPLRRSEIVRTVRKALEKRALVVENRALRNELARTRSGVMIAHSAVMRRVTEDARQVADSMASVLLTGENGTGKGMMARWIHAHSPRRDGPMVTVNCSALPETLLESELFGYEPGAFTGAKGRKEGRFDMAQAGTLFLDEFTEIARPIQAKLLRVLQDGEYERLGGTKTLTSSARMIAATNRDPEEAVKDGSLRQDLYYRLNVIRIDVPPLRERIDDIVMLVRHFVMVYAERHGRTVEGIHPDALDALQSWTWPGNVRELENCIERAVVLSRKPIIGLSELPAPIAQNRRQPDQVTFPVGTPLRVIERRMIEATLKRVDGDKHRAADLLGITTRTIYRREAEWRGGDS